jgi:hypothetical protein
MGRTKSNILLPNDDGVQGMPEDVLTPAVEKVKTGPL